MLLRFRSTLNQSLDVAFGDAGQALLHYYNHSEALLGQTIRFDYTASATA